MLLPHLQALNSKRIILASGSPRRHELLTKQLGLKVEVVVSSFEELLPKANYQGPDGAARYAVDTARGKVLDVYARLCAPATGGSSATPPAAALAGQPVPQPVSLLIGADTVVEHGGLILEKPDDAAMAARMLSLLSGSTHHVHTGVVLVVPPRPPQESSASAQPAGLPETFVHSFSVSTEVVFDNLSDEVIQAYIATGEPFGKAGSYGIQGVAGSFVKSVDGCFFSVVGFPVHRFASEVVQLIRTGTL